MPPIYTQALRLLHRSLQDSANPAPAAARLAALSPSLPDPDLIQSSPFFPELANLGIPRPDAGPGQYPLDHRSSACLLALCDITPFSTSILYFHLFSLYACRPDPDPRFVSSLCQAICRAAPNLTTTKVVHLALQAALHTSSLPVLLGLVQALSELPLLSRADLLRDGCISVLSLARDQLYQAVQGHHRRRRHQWGQLQTRTIRAISIQLQSLLHDDAVLCKTFYSHALGVLGCKDDNEWRISPSSPVSVDMYTACAQLCVSCALADTTLASELMHCFLKSLRVSLRSAPDAKTTPSSKAVFSQLLACVTRLVVHHHRLIGIAVDQLKGLLETAALQQHSDYEDLHEMVSAALADILRAELVIPGRKFADMFARKLVFSLDQNLLADKDESSMADQSLLLLLGRVTALINSPRLTEHVLPMLMNRFTNSPKLLHIVIPHLTTIALLSEARIFNDVVSLLTNIYSKPFIPDNKWNRKEIPDALLHLATEVTAPDLRAALLKSLLRLFKTLGRQIQERMEQSSLHGSSSMAGVLGFLLPALAVLMVSGDAEPPSTSIARHPSLVRFSPWNGTAPPAPKPVTAFESIDADVKWFRTLWNYLVLYRFADATAASMWPPTWASAVATIAAHTPALALSVTAGSQHLDIDLFAETGISQVCVGELRQRLTTLYPSQVSVASSLSVGSLAYVLVIDALESARVRSGTVLQLFAYLHDQTNAAVTKLVDTVADHVFDLYLEVMGAASADSARRENLESHCVFLFSQSCSRYQRVATKASFYLKEIVSRFPFLQWSKECLSFLFHLYNSLQDMTADIDLISPPSTASTTITHLALDLPDDCRSRATLQNHIQRMLARWLENATFTVPSHMSSMLQVFVQDWHDRNTQSPSFGVTIALRHLLSGKRQSLLAAPSDLDLTAAQFANSLTARQRYLGDIRGRFFSFCQVKDHNLPFGACLAADLLRDFHDILGRHRRGQNDAPIAAEFRRCMYLSAALLVWSATAPTAEDDAACQMSATPLAMHRAVDPRELMHLVCMAPVYMFTGDSMDCALQVWAWLFAVSHAFSVGLLVTMKSAWTYTIETRLGLFSPRPDQAAAQYHGCLFTRMAPAYHPGWNDAAPHGAWITFLLDRFDTIADCSIGCLRAIQFMLHKALSRPDYLCTAPTSFGARFRLLLLGLRIVHICPGQDLLRNRILSVAFAWFSEGARWSPHESWAEVVRDSQIIVAFIEAMRRDFGSSSSLPDVAAVPISSASVAPVLNRLAVMDATVPSVSGSVAPAPSVMRSARPGTDPTDIFTYAGSDAAANLNQIDLDYGLRPEIDDAISVGIEWQRAHHDLLVLLMSHEFHLLVAWHNPRRHPDRVLRDENLYAYNPTAGLSQDDWRRFFAMSWQIDPHIAYRLVQRFPYVPVLRHLLRLKMQTQPLALRSIGDAVRLVCNSRNCRSNSSLLKQILSYEACSLPTALKLLCKPYAENAITSQYTMRSLAQHAHSGVIFYMPEMIQALRNDASGSLAEFLKAAGTQSPHLAHQLVWALQTESILDENARRRIQNDPLPGICAELEHQVIASFSDDAAAFFRAEFDFFEQITRLSSDLLVIPKIQKDERRARLQAELKRIRLDTLQSSKFPLYLPIDHTAQVVDIIVTTAKPLQSAARVPFLVEFLVKKQGEKDEVVSDPEPIKLKMPHLVDDAPQVLTKQVIFKAGDDCRQDCLALQFIRLSKDILKSVGLPLYLFPYLVIPNRTGQYRDLGGVIECVRKSSSRDELGKVNGLSLREYFLSRYGRPEGGAFKQAQRNFILSMAGYAVCCYLLQVKDRHNGNILLDEAGHVIHIDFGFIFDISPAKDMKFESAGFKLTLEMVEVMDNLDSDMWNWFVDLCVRGYLAVRAHRDDFLALADVMSDSALGCFKPDSVRNLKHRFVPEKNERDAAQHMINVVLDSYNKFTTNTYDSIQYLQQGIYYYAGQT